jgi:3-isopropylmalate/(R)-2-methylmalate dehydratase small subunit
LNQSETHDLSSEKEPPRMSVNEIKTVVGSGIPLLLDDIDTDRIIPARFLRCVSFEGLGEHAFEDDRRQDPEHAFNQEQFQDAEILLGGRNFGCGSSREHAPQSLMRWGIKAIVAESFAEIFFGNCNSLGIPAMVASRTDLERLAAAVRADPPLDITVDLQHLTVEAGDLCLPMEMPDSARNALITGRWDYLGQLLSAADDVRDHAATIPYLQNFRSS